MNRKKVSKKALSDARKDVKAWKASGAAGQRYKADDADAYALAIIRLLATLPVVDDASLAGKRKAVDAGHPCVSEDWYIIHPDMKLPTRPDQGFESRMLTNVRHADESVGWGWVNHSNHGFVIVRTA